MINYIETRGLETVIPKSAEVSGHRYALEPRRIGKGKLKGIVFDLDGTLVNSTIDFYKMKLRMISYLENLGVPKGLLNPTETTVVILEKVDKVWKERGLSDERKKEIQAELDAMMDQTELEAVSTVEAIEGAPDAIRRLREMGYRLAVLTRGHREYTVEALKKTGMLEYFDVILGRGETPKPKPYAEALFRTADLMGLKLDELVFVGDHQIDSACAENACVSFIGVRTGPRKEESWGPSEPRVLLDSIRDLPDYLARL